MNRNLENTISAQDSTHGRKSYTPSERKGLIYANGNGGGLAAGFEKLRQTADRLKKNGSHKDETIVRSCNDIIPPNEIPGEQPSLHLWMFQPENLEATINSKLAQEFYSKNGSAWVSARQDQERFEQRENTLKEKRLQKGHAATPKEYDQLRQTELESLDQHAARRINNGFSEAVKKISPSGESPIRFANRQYEQANRTLSYVSETLFPHVGFIDTINEASLNPISAAKVVKRVTSPDTNPKLRSEEIRRQLLALVAGENEVKDRTVESSRKLAQIHELLDHELYSGMSGQTEIVNIKALFENDTNNLLAIHDIEGSVTDPGPGMHMKQVVLPMRRVKGFESDKTMKDMMVFTNPHPKRREAADAKALKKASIAYVKTGNDTITADSVTDRMRLGIVVYGNKQQADKIFERIGQTIQNPDNQRLLADFDENDAPILENGEYKGRVVAVIEDSKTNGTIDQKSPEFRRYQVKFDGGLEAEIMVKTIRNFLREELEVGQFDETSKDFTGKAHELYEIRRLIDVSKFLFPQKVYHQMDLAREAIKTLKAKGEELKKRVKMKK